MELRAWLLLLSGGLAACSVEEPFQARFAVRGRWRGERDVVYRIDSVPGTLSAEASRSAIKAAILDWRATGCASFREAHVDDVPNLTFGWRRGNHDACVPFGTDPSVAHSGPVGPGTFVHFDAGREWSAEGEHGLSLRQAALHEIGHALGLDHSPDEQAAMYPEPARARSRLGRSDLAGIHALYGGATSAPGDLVITSAQGTLAVTLSEVAPAALTEWALFDCDGDGDQEVLVWHQAAHDAVGSAADGALWVFHFTHGPVLATTVGPLYGVAGPGCRLSFTRSAEGERLLLLDPEQGPRQARVFDERGLPQLFEGTLPELPLAPEKVANPQTGDLDGDGTPETVTRRE